MAVNQSRSLNVSLDEGATDGSYRKDRPNVEQDAFDSTPAARRNLSPTWNYGTQREASVKVRPDGVIARA